MSELVVGQEADAQSADAYARAVLRIRSAATGLVLLPAAAAVILVAADLTGTTGAGWESIRGGAIAVAAVVLVLAVCVGTVIVRARPAITPTVDIAERSAPDLYNLVRDLADRLDVPVPSAVALTPDCDSWLEDRNHPSRRSRASAAPAPGGSGRNAAPVLVIGSPFLWWMRVAELRALLAPVVAGTGPSAHPDVAAARRFVRGLDAALAVAETPRGPLAAPALRFLRATVRLLLRSVGPYAAEMERGAAVSSSARAQTVDQGLRTVAQEQVGLAYAGWDRLLTRVALPAWRIGRWPARLDAGVVSALTELSRRDSLAEGFGARLGERPACDLIEEPGEVDRRISLLAARLFHAGPREPGPEWAPVDWQAYPEEIVDRIWRSEAARLFRVLDASDASDASDAPAPPASHALRGPTISRVMERLTGSEGGTEALAAGIAAAVAREESGAGSRPIPGAPQNPVAPMGLPLPPHRSGIELMTEHVTAAVCCAAVDTAGGAPGLDWLDGPVLRVGGARRADPAGPVRTLVEDGDAGQLRAWLAEVGVRPEKPLRLV